MNAQAWIMKTEIDSVPAKGCELIAVIREKLETLAWSQDDLFRIHLALEEVIMNAIKHGNDMDESRKVSVDCNVANDMFTVIVKDEGEGFIREEIPDPTEGDNVYRESGRGLKIIENFMTSVEYIGCGNVVAMTKKKSTEEAS